MKKKMIACIAFLGIAFVALLFSFTNSFSLIEVTNNYFYEGEVSDLNSVNNHRDGGFLAPKREIIKASEGEKICYLTFDDGPSKNTVKILDILKQYDAKATFFVIGNCIGEETRDILERMIAEGHAIGLHANNHVYEKFYADETSYLKDYETLYETLKKDYGIETALFRLPGGSACKYLYGKGCDYVKQMQKKVVG